MAEDPCKIKIPWFQKGLVRLTPLTSPLRRPHATIQRLLISNGGFVINAAAVVTSLDEHEPTSEFQEGISTQGMPAWNLRNRIRDEAFRNTERLQAPNPVVPWNPEECEIKRVGEPGNSRMASKNSVEFVTGI